jgi:hypothetical protein
MLALVLTFNSCSKLEEDNFTNSQNIDLSLLDLSKKVNVKSSTDLLSQVSFGLGINKINVIGSKRSEQERVYTFEATNSFNLNGINVNLDGSSFKLEKGFLVNLKNLNKGISTIDNNLILKNKNMITELNDNSDVLDNDMVILYFVMNELITDENKTQYFVPKFCSSKNTYHTVSTGASRSVASNNGERRANMDATLISASGSSCTEQGHDTSCLWENHLCVSTTTYCCPQNDPPY